MTRQVLRAATMVIFVDLWVTMLIRTKQRSWRRLFFGGKGGNALCTVALSRRVWDSSAVSRWVLITLWTVRLTYPLKSPHAGLAGHIPLGEICDWA